MEAKPAHPTASRALIMHSHSLPMPEPVFVNLLKVLSNGAGGGPKLVSIDPF